MLEIVVVAPERVVVDSNVIPPPPAGVAHSGAVAPELTCKTCPAVPIPNRIGTVASR